MIETTIVLAGLILVSLAAVHFTTRHWKRLTCQKMVFTETRKKLENSDFQSSHVFFIETDSHLLGEMECLNRKIQIELQKI